MPVSSNTLGKTIKLRDGRSLGYAEFGDPKGKPIFFFHGYPGSRLEGEFFAEAAEKVGACIISSDRPGSGLSDFKPDRKILDWPDDVIELADALEIERFVVAGMSGGGPYTAACAFKIPMRLNAAGIIAGVSSFDAPGATEGMSQQNRLIFALAGRAPWLYRLPMWFMARVVLRNPDRFLSQMMNTLPQADRAIVARPEVKEMFLKDAAEAFRQGTRGAVQEGGLYARPWGFRLGDISMEVHLWQGEMDVNVPPSMGRYQASAIPNCRATFYPDDGHLSMIDHAEEILSALIA